jgi:hypothetical protein
MRESKKAVALFGIGLVVLLAAGSRADGAPMTFQVDWSGAPNGNGAVATALLTIDDALLPNPGSYINSTVLPSFILDFTITVSGATSGNGTFTLSDFGGTYWSTQGGTLDLTQQLVGQPTSGLPWGTTNDGNSGDFNMFALNPSAPSGTFFFQLTTAGGTGNTMNLTSFVEAPEPASLGLMLAGGLALGGFAAVRRREQLKTTQSEVR